MEEQAVAAIKRANAKAQENPDEFVEIGDSPEEARALYEEAKARVAAEFGQDVENVQGWITVIHLADDSILIGGNAADPFSFMLHAIAQSSPEHLLGLMSEGLGNLLDGLAGAFGGDADPEV